MHFETESEELEFIRIKPKKKKQKLDVEVFPDDREDLVDPTRGKGRRNYSRKGTGHYKRSQANKNGK
jgi:hypothetical protein